MGLLRQSTAAKGKRHGNIARQGSLLLPIVGDRAETPIAASTAQIRRAR